MLTPFRKLLLTVLFLSYLISAFGQTKTQTVRGQVVDAVTNEPLIGANVQVMELGQLFGTTTDIDGNYTLENVPLGWRTFQCSYTGYEMMSVTKELSVAKEAVIDFNLPSGAIDISEVVVTGLLQNTPINALATVSSRSISPLETRYMATSINDIGRTALSFPGVQPSKDNESDIIIRGNSSVGLGWRLEGVDILNPNHFARKGGTGGGVTMFSFSLMDQSDFFTGAFPAEYGNALSGVFDLHFRKGNDQKREHTFRAGMIGIDLASEGPFKKGGASYLFNYRYSTLGLLNKMGLYLVDEQTENDFQDLSFSLFFPSKTKKSSLKIWGVGGLSMEEGKVEDMEKWQVFSDSTDVISGSDMGVIGVTFNTQLKNNSFLKVTLAGMAQRSFYEQRVHSEKAAPIKNRDQEYRQGNLSLASYFSKKVGASSYFKAGLQATHMRYDLQYDTIFEGNTYRKLVSGKGNNLLLQPYAQVQWLLSEKWKVNVGMHAIYFGLNNSFSVEPRVGGTYCLNEFHSISFGYGLHSRLVPLGSYFSVVNGQRPNTELDLMKAHHFVFSHEYNLKKGYRLTSELYYQYLFDIPVGTEMPGTFWVLNNIEGFADEALVSKGSGQNYGLDILLEKHFKDGLFMLLSGSVFNSTFKPLNGMKYSTQYNSRFTSSFTIGKEIALSTSSKLQLGGKTLFNAGMPSTPVNNQTGEDTRPIYDEENPFSERVKPYFRIDTRIAFKKNSNNVWWLLALDIQNVTNRQNLRPFGWNYDLEEMAWYRKTQASLIPLLSFQLDF